MACSSDSPSQAPSATVAAGRTSSTGTNSTPPPSTTTSEAIPAASPLSSAEHEVEAAYLRSWDVYTDAMLRLDPSRLEEAYSGSALEVRKAEIADLAKLQTPVRVRVDHDYEVVLVNADTAFVLETYLNHSVYLDGATMQPIEPDPNNVLEREYVLRKEPGGWRVSRINAGS